MTNKCFSVKCTKNQLFNPHENLHFAVRFQPMKPFKANIEFIVLRQTGGRWKYKIILEATKPDEDDVIIISSPLNKTASVSFQLTNKTKGYAKFYAGFTPNFQLYQKLVILNHMEEKELLLQFNLQITYYTPIENGKIRKGKLVIQTEDMYWSYLIKGILPKYIPPQIKQSNIDNHLMKSQIYQSTIIDQSKNYVVENIKKARQLTPPTSKRQMFLEASFLKKQNIYILYILIYYNIIQINLNLYKEKFNYFAFSITLVSKYIFILQFFIRFLQLYARD
ncbi:unnamed protein product [Paramecium sonneborni]|uniref:CFAP47-like immunoglobulin-like domain-containing protein n=1 Tax=Paramecium sonneborni TaxID=65129 RepID=A0A8S1KRD2_9CILI|nr:unnamed protein product [Paramecium sonneborni]